MWLCLFLPRLAIETTTGTGGAAMAITDWDGPRRLVVDTDARARDRGIVPGTPVTQASALLPSLRLVPRRFDRERTALLRLAAWAMQYTSFVHLPVPPPEPGAGRLLLEIGGSLGLFGGRAALVQRAVSGLRTLGYTARPGVADTPAAAALRARATGDDSLEDLPLTLLELPSATLASLQDSGLRRIGDVLALPRADLGRRYGRDCLDYLARLTGDKADPVTPFQPPRRYRARVELDAEVESAEPLRFPLRRLIGELAGGLRGLDSAIQHLALDLEHSDRSATPVRLRLSRPTRDARRMQDLIEERIARLSLPAPVRALRLVSGRYREFIPRQHDLLTTQAEGGEALHEVLDRLRARLGDDAVRQPRRCADHRPERAGRLTAEVDVGWTSIDARRPIWLLECPEPLNSPPTLITGAERIESGWWEADVSRDYYVARASDGRRLWVYRERRSPHRWFLHGLFA